MLILDEANEFTVLRDGAATTATVCGDGAEGTDGFPDDVIETELVFVELEDVTLLVKFPVEP